MQIELIDVLTCDEPVATMVLLKMVENGVSNSVWLSLDIIPRRIVGSTELHSIESQPVPTTEGKTP
jgi:hypothetical protein